MLTQVSGWLAVVLTAVRAPLRFLLAYPRTPRIEFCSPRKQDHPRFFAPMSSVGSVGGVTPVSFQIISTP